MVLNLSSNGRPTRVRASGFLITMPRKEAKMVVMMNLEQNLFPSTASFGASVSIDNIYYVIQYRCLCRDHRHLRGEGGEEIIFIMSFNIDVGVAIIVISGEKGAEYSRQSCRSCLQ